MKRTIAIVSVFVLVSLTSGFAEAGAAKPKKATLPVILNILPGLGIGSFVQGDPLGGLIGLGGEVTGASLVGGGMVYGYANLIGAIFSGMTGNVDSSIEKGFSASVYLVIGGAVLWTGTKVFEIIRPIGFARDFNRKNGFSGISLAPALSPTGDSGGEALKPALALTFSY